MITLVRQIDTPWSPYAVTFSRDGTRLAIGGGSWYGEGGLMLVGVDDDRVESLPWADTRWREVDGADAGPPRPASVSGLCFSDDDRFLAASMWSSSQRWAPTMLLDVEGTRLRLRELFNYRGVVPYRIELARPLLMGRLTATGVVLHDGYIITRRHRTSERNPDVLVLDRLTAGLDVRAAGHTQHLTHSRLVVVRNTVISEAEGRCYEDPLTHTSAPVPRPKGLEMRDLSDPDAPPRLVPVIDFPRITAIASSPGNQGFIIGGNQRQIDEWWWDGAWQRRQLRAPDAPNRMPQGGKDGLEFPGIQAMVTLAESNTLVAASADGQLFVRSPDGEWTFEQLPRAGKPRSMAAHPTRPWVAVGIKQGRRQGVAGSVVVILAIEADA